MWPGNFNTLHCSSFGVFQSDSGALIVFLSWFVNWSWFWSCCGSAALVDQATTCRPPLDIGFHWSWTARDNGKQENHLSDFNYKMQVKSNIFCHNIWWLLDGCLCVVLPWHSRFCWSAFSLCRLLLQAGWWQTKSRQGNDKWQIKQSCSFNCICRAADNMLGVIVYSASFEFSGTCSIHSVLGTTTYSWNNELLLTSVPDGDVLSVDGSMIVVLVTMLHIHRMKIN